MTADLPKAELHCHFEGSMSPELVRRLAARNDIELPAALFDEEGEFAWVDFPDFLNAYDMAAKCIRTVEDIRDVMYEYLAACAAEGVIYVEMFSSPDHAANMGLSYAQHLEGKAAGVAAAEKDFGIIGRVIVTCVRHLGPEAALGVAQSVIAEPHPVVVGFGMGGNELAHTKADFKPAFDLVSSAGLACTVHAGEVDGAQSVWDALNLLPVSRIGHGVRCIEDPDLVEEIVKRNIHLEVCPTSNVATNVYADYASHPLLRLMEAGCSVSLNSDDPPYFATSVGREYAVAAEHFGLGREDLMNITRDAIEASFADDETKSRLRARLKVL